LVELNLRYYRNNKIEIGISNFKCKVNRKGENKFYFHESMLNVNVNTTIMRKE